MMRRSRNPAQRTALMILEGNPSSDAALPLRRDSDQITSDAAIRDARTR